MNPIWVDEEGVLLGQGRHSEFDPGTGPDRYHTALQQLRHSGRPTGFASFTFDRDDHGSLLIVPEATTRELALSPDSPPSGCRIVDDGVDLWRTGFGKAMLEIETRRVEKVVLARQVRVEIPDGMTADGILARLLAGNPDCYLFSIAGLVGASPELLVSLRNGRVRTLALAGTAVDPDQLETAKIYEEHRHVANSVTGVLERHITTVDVTEQVVVPHGVMSHIGTRIEGPARPGTTVADILADLHPTAAVAGSPTDSAIDLIREIEPGSRGRYAGPVGWMGADGDGVFAIALRCGQIDGSTMILYAGGGLVDGSEEKSELEETELKLAPMLAALGQPPS
ncbi:MAG: chorismate-binding protein [Acidimicrobiia bacterium]|jgi:menaquinone-specific isochorismate synthase